MKKKPAEDEITTLLGEGASFEGDLTFTGSVRVDGRLKGRISSGEATLVVGKGGHVSGEVTVANLVLSGTMSGTVTVSGLTRLVTESDFSGDLTTGRLLCEDGAMVQGTFAVGKAPQTRTKK
ncbi:polymer-forming cytoskeletal protein [Myxococcota bacterium]|nr:polymer-forming cytoskeletal protein [Myxococcota bacterium]